jgi:protease IV
MKGISDDVETKYMKSKLGEQYVVYKQIQNLGKINGIQARLPYDIDIR